MHSEPLDAVPLWLFFAGSCALAGGALEAGYRYARWRRGSAAEEKEGPVGAMVGSILALLAFMLAFTFGMAGARFEARRQVILEESNSIGTTYLRARLLHEPQRTASIKFLQEYVDLRIRGSHRDETEHAIQRSEEIHGLLWNEANKEAASNPSPITALYVHSLNQTIDIHSIRVQAGIRNRIPMEIWLVLFALAALSMASMGYQAGLSATRRSPAMAGLVVAFAGILFLIAAVERPQEDSQVNQAALISLQESMKKDNP